MSPKYINDLFEIPNKDMILAMQTLQFLDKTVKYGKHSLRYLGPFIWTRLNGKERASLNIHIFRNCIKLYLKTYEALLIDNLCNEHCRLCNFS